MTAAPFDTLKLSRQLQLPLELRQARREAIRRRNHGNETFAEIGRSLDDFAASNSASISNA